MSRLRELSEGLEQALAGADPGRARPLRALAEAALELERWLGDLPAAPAEGAQALERAAAELERAQGELARSLHSAAAERRLGRAIDRAREAHGWLAEQAEALLLQAVASGESAALTLLPRAQAPCALGARLLAAWLERLGLALPAAEQGEDRGAAAARELPSGAATMATWVRHGGREAGRPAIVLLRVGEPGAPLVGVDDPWVLPLRAARREGPLAIEVFDPAVGVGLERWLADDPDGELRLALAAQLAWAAEALAAVGAAPLAAGDLVIGEASGGQPMLRVLGRGGDGEGLVAAVFELVERALGETGALLLRGVDRQAPDALPRLGAALAAALRQQPAMAIDGGEARIELIERALGAQQALLGELERLAGERGWDAGIFAGANDEAGDPESPAVLAARIDEELLPYFRRPYQIALMGVFSSGKTFLINKLLLALGGLPLAPYEPNAAYRQDARYLELAPYLRRSTAEPTDTVVTILRAADQPGDEALASELAELVRQPRPVWPSDPLEFPIPLPELQRFNLIDTPGLNEDLTVNKRVGAFLQSCDLIVYVFAATGVMNSQDHFLIRRKHELAPGKRMVFVINMIDTLLDRVSDQRFWLEAHHGAVVKAALPLRKRIKAEVGEITGEAPPLELGDDLWVTSGKYDFNVETLCAHLQQTIAGTAGRDRLLATPQVVLACGRWTARFSRRLLAGALLPRIEALASAEAELTRAFAVELPRRVGDDLERALTELNRRHGASVEPLRFEPAELAERPPSPPLATQLELTVDASAWRLEGREAARDFPVIAALEARADAVREAELTRLTAALPDEACQQGLAVALAEAAAADEATRARYEAAFVELAEATSPDQQRALETTLGAELERRSRAVCERLEASYQALPGPAFRAPGTTTEAVARALLAEGGASHAAGAAGATTPLEAERAQTQDALAELGQRLAADIEALGAQHAAIRQRADERLAAALADLQAAAEASAPDQALADVGAAERLARFARWGGVALGALLLLIGLLVGGWTTLALLLIGALLAAAGHVLSGQQQALAEAAAEAAQQRLELAWDQARLAYQQTLSEIERETHEAQLAWLGRREALAAAAAAAREELEDRFRAQLGALFGSGGGADAGWRAALVAEADRRLTPLRDELAALRSSAARVERTAARALNASRAPLATLQLLARAHALAPDPEPAVSAGG